MRTSTHCCMVVRIARLDSPPAKGGRGYLACPRELQKPLGGFKNRNSSLLTKYCSQTKRYPHRNILTGGIYCLPISTEHPALVSQPDPANNVWSPLVLTQDNLEEDELADLPNEVLTTLELVDLYC
jgi:hypothetical protein